MELKEEFPCGYKRTIKAGLLAFLFGEGKIELDGKCPIHGKKCKRGAK